MARKAKIAEPVVLDPSRLWLGRTPFLMPLYIALALSEAQFDECLDHIKQPMRNRPKFLNKNADATMHTFDHPENRDLVCIVCMTPRDETKEPNEVCGLLVHEAVHIWQKVESALGDFGPEGEAYHIQYIAQQLFVAYGERRAEL